MNKIDQNTWMELNTKAYATPLPKNPSKLKLLADQNIPLEIVEDLKMNHFAIKSIYEINMQGHPDENILLSAKKLNRVLLTTDKDFWDERKHPIQKHFGVFCIESGPQQTENIYRSIAQIILKLARFISNEWWDKTKVHLKTDGFTIRRLEGGLITETEYKFVGKKIYFREIR